MTTPVLSSDSRENLELALNLGHKVVSSLRWIGGILLASAFGAGVFFTKMDNRMSNVEYGMQKFVLTFTSELIPKVNRLEREQIRIQSKVGMLPEHQRE